MKSVEKKKTMRNRESNVKKRKKEKPDVGPAASLVFRMVKGWDGARRWLQMAAMCRAGGTALCRAHIPTSGFVGLFFLLKASPIGLLLGPRRCSEPSGFAWLPTGIASARKPTAPGRQNAAPGFLPPQAFIPETAAKQTSLAFPASPFPPSPSQPRYSPPTLIPLPGKSHLGDPLQNETTLQSLSISSSQSCHSSLPWIQPPHGCPPSSPGWVHSSQGAVAVPHPMSESAVLQH